MKTIRPKIKKIRPKLRHRKKPPEIRLPLFFFFTLARNGMNPVAGQFPV
jgi:hypothetical protein